MGLGGGGFRSASLDMLSCGRGEYCGGGVLELVFIIVDIKLNPCEMIFDHVDYRNENPFDLMLSVDLLSRHIVSYGNTVELPEIIVMSASEIFVTLNLDLWIGRSFLFPNEFSAHASSAWLTITSLSVLERPTTSSH